jgi:sulfoxide reductase catalytic subunit YedY
MASDDSKKNTPRSSEITPERQYLERRQFLKQAGLFTATAAGLGGGLTWLTARRGGARSAPSALAADGGTIDSQLAELPHTRSEWTVADPPTPYRDVTTYNNFYEFGLDKSDPAQHAHTLRPRPRALEVSGLVHKPETFDVDDLLQSFPLEERVYRFRCVEAWSMVIP